MKDLTILIVGFNNNDLIVSCLNSFYFDLLKQEKITFEVIIVENGNLQFEDFKFLKGKINIKWIKSKYNSGFARGNNLGFQHANGRKILIMNPDMEISFDTILTLFERQKDQSNYISSCRLTYPDGEEQMNSFRRTYFLKEIFNKNMLLKKIKIQFREIYYDDIIGFTGALFLFDRLMLENNRIFNPIYFMYEEENDFFYTMSKRKAIIQFNNDLNATHATEGTITSSQWTFGQKLVSKHQFIRNNFSIWYYLLYLLMNQFNLLLKILFNPFLKEKDRMIKTEIIVNKYLIEILFKPKKFYKLSNNLQIHKC